VGELSRGDLLCSLHGWVAVTLLVRNILDASGDGRRGRVDWPSWDEVGEGL